MRYISTFSGIEAASAAWEPIGWEPVAFCEIDEFPSAVLTYHYPNVPNLGDITKVDWERVIKEYGKPDVVVGGSPCQSFSVAGGRESLGGESRLMFEYIRALAEIQPAWFLWENVPGVLNTRDDAFAQLLREVQDVGYGSVAWRVLDAQFVRVADRDGDGRIARWVGPVAQRRRRVFLVGHLGAGGGAAAVLFESESVRGNTQTSKQKREELARAAGRDAAARCGDGNSLTPWDVQSKRIFQEDGTAPTLNSGSGEGMTIQPSVLQSAGFKYHQGAGAGNIGYEEEQSQTLTADYHQPAVALQTGHTGGNGSGINTEDVSYTLSLANDHAVAFAQNSNGEDVVGTLCARDHKGVGNEYVDEGKVIMHHNYQQTAADGYIVRRLTPVECERLQGFPDGWTDVTYKGNEHPSDTPRYKAIGNSMAVPVMRWIGERIQMVDEIIKSMKM